MKSRMHGHIHVSRLLFCYNLYKNLHNGFAEYSEHQRVQNLLEPSLSGSTVSGHTEVYCIWNQFESINGKIHDKKISNLPYP
jgi:hypothetical protein